MTGILYLPETLTILTTSSVEVGNTTTEGFDAGLSSILALRAARLSFARKLVLTFMVVVY